MFRREERSALVETIFEDGKFIIKTKVIKVVGINF